MADELAGKREIFCREYIKDLNGTQAAIRAGYSKKTAHSIANEILMKPEVQEYINVLKAERAMETKIDAAYVLQKLHAISEMDVLDILENDGTFKPIREWPKIWRQYLSGIEVAELFEGRGDDREIIGVLKKVKWPDKIKNLELLGKHVDVQAFREQHDLKSTDGSMSPKSTIDTSNLTTEQLAALHGALGNKSG